MGNVGCNRREASVAAITSPEDTGRSSLRFAAAASGELADRMRAEASESDARCGYAEKVAQTGARGQPLALPEMPYLQWSPTYILAPSPSEVEHLLPPLDLDVAFRRRAEDEVDHFALLLDLACDEFASGVDDFEEPAVVVLVVQGVEDESREILRSRGRVERVVPLATHNRRQLLPEESWRRWTHSRFLDFGLVTPCGFASCFDPLLPCRRCARVGDDVERAQFSTEWVLVLGVCHEVQRFEQVLRVLVVGDEEFGVDEVDECVCTQAEDSSG